jgi:aconitate decarboxylase
MSTTATSSVTSSDAADAGRAATDPAGPTGSLATWLSATTLTDVPASVRERAKYLLLDGVGCALVGAQLPVSRIGVDGVLAFDPKAQPTRNIDPITNGPWDLQYS